MNEDAVIAYINKNISPDDLEFADTLNSQITVQTFRKKKLTGLQKKIHCTQTRRAAKAHGFIN
jgi:hypothetical protein